MVPTYNSRSEADVAACKEYEAARWGIDLATFPDDADGMSEDDGYLTWSIRRCKRERDAVHNVTIGRVGRVHAYFDRLRSEQRWLLEKPMIATANFFVKRVVTA